MKVGVGSGLPPLKAAVCATCPPDEVTPPTRVTRSFLGIRSTLNTCVCLSRRDKRPPHLSRICARTSVPTLALRVFASSTAFREWLAASIRMSLQLLATISSTEESSSPHRFSRGGPWGLACSGDDWCEWCILLDGRDMGRGVEAGLCIIIGSI